MLIYWSTVKLNFTATQRKVLVSLELIATTIIGKGFPSVIQNIYKDDCCSVEKCLTAAVNSLFYELHERVPV